MIFCFNSNVLFQIIIYEYSKMSICPTGFLCFDNNTFILLIIGIIILVVFLINKHSNKFQEVKMALESTQNDYNTKINELRQYNDSGYDYELEKINNPLSPPLRTNPYLTPGSIATRGPSSGYQQVGVLIQDIPEPSYHHREVVYTGGSYSYQNDSDKPRHKNKESKQIQPVINNNINVDTQKPKEVQLSSSKQESHTIEPKVEEPKIVVQPEIKQEEKKEEEEHKEGFMNFFRDNNKKILPLYGEETYRGSNQWRYYTSTDGYHSLKLPVYYRNRSCQDEYGCGEIYDGDMVRVEGYNSPFKASIYKLGIARYIPFL